MFYETVCAGTHVVGVHIVDTIQTYFTKAVTDC